MYIRKAILALSLGLLLPVATAPACGPDFPQSLLADRKSSLFDLPDGMFFFEAARLLPAPHDTLRAVEGSAWDDHDETRAAAEAMGLAAAEVAKVKAMRAAHDADAAAAAGVGLSAELREYTLGAIAFRKGEQAAAQDHFRAVLALPPPQRLRRGLWAQYMLGRSLVASGDSSGADAAFVDVRERVLAGIPDPQGLAVASFGEQGRIAWHHGAVAPAVRWYAQQAAHDSLSGAASLLFVARSLLAHREQLDQALADPVAQRLLAAYLFTRSNEFEQVWPPAGSSPEADNEEASGGEADAGKRTGLIGVTEFLQIVQARGIAHFEGADRLAAGAYRAGRYDLAGQLAAKSDTALAAWVRGKLALRAGDTATAAREYALAARGFPANEAWSDAIEGDMPSVQSPLCRVEAERGILALSRDDYLDAMVRLYAGASEFWPDAAYVAERVLTVDELKAFVDKNAPAAARTVPKDGVLQADSPATQLRRLLARRLLRVGRLQQALPYFDDPALRKKAQVLVDAHRDDNAWLRSARAAALFAQAKVIRRDGMELLGTELEPDNAQYGGSYGADDLPPTADRHWSGGGEAARVAASAVKPDARYHYRYLAANLAEQAASLVPARSQAYAAMMCSATGWMLDTDAASAQRIYHRYLRNGAYVPWGANFGQSCPVPDFHAARWLPLRQAWWTTRHWTKRFWPVPLGGVLLVVGLVFWRRRRT